MAVKFFRSIRFHILVWIAMFAFFVFAPDLHTLMFVKNGKPFQADHVSFVESDQIGYAVDGFETYRKDGDELYNLYGWALIVPEDSMSTAIYTREVVLTSDNRKYVLPIKSGYRNPELPYKFLNADVDLKTLGFNAFIAEDVIKPGKYRIGFLFKNTTTGSAFYWDKPVYYLVKTPNTIRLERK